MTLRSVVEPLSFLTCFFADDSIIFGRATSRELVTINDILNSYEKASGQKVNYAKSEISFSPNVSTGACDSLK